MSRPYKEIDMSNLSAPLSDITNTPRAKDDDEKADVDSRVVWAPKIKYNYAVYNASSREEQEALKDELPNWAASAEKYEWKDDYGDIGPEHPELEKQLFGGEFLVRSGADMEKFAFPFLR